MAGRIPRLAPEGWKHLAATAVLFALLALGGGTPGAMVGLVAFALVANFFRDPERFPPDDPLAIVAPADGRVLAVDSVEDDRFQKGPALRISIFMSPVDVHVNRIPWSGRVAEVRYHHGKYFRAFAEKASLDNEQNAIVVEDEAGRRLGVVQIAGFIARRIVCRVAVGDAVQRGNRYGLIQFGSRADVYLPPDVEVAVRAGDRTRAGETILARWPTA